MKWLLVVLLFNTALDFINPDNNYQEALVLLQYFIMLIPIVIISKKIKNKYYFFPLFILLLYIFLSSLRSTDYFVTYNHNMKVLFSSLYIVVGYYAIKRIEDLRKLISYLFIIITSFVLYIIIVNIFNIGGYLYGDSGIVRTGYLSGARIYPYAIIVLLSPIISNLSGNNIKTFIYYLVSIVVIIIIVLIARRTAVIILLFGLFSYYLFKLSLVNILKLLLISSVLSVILLSISDTVRSAYDVRGDSITDVENISNERRFQEYEAILSTIDNNTYHLIFGTGEFFNTRGQFGLSHWRDWGDRRIHSDYGILLHGGGIFALLLYIIFLLTLYIKTFRLRPSDKLYSDLKILLIIMIVIATIVSSVGGFYYISYFSLVMLLIGAFISLIELNETNNNIK